MAKILLISLTILVGFDRFDSERETESESESESERDRRSSNGRRRYPQAREAKDPSDRYPGRRRMGFRRRLRCPLGRPSKLSASFSASLVFATVELSYLCLQIGFYGSCS